LPQVVDQGTHRLGVALEALGAGIDLRSQDCHAGRKLPSAPRARNARRADRHGIRESVRQSTVWPMKARWLASAAAKSGSWSAGSFSTVSACLRNAAMIAAGHCLIVTPAAFSFSSASPCVCGEWLNIQAMLARQAVSICTRKGAGKASHLSLRIRKL